MDFEHVRIQFITYGISKVKIMFVQISCLVDASEEHEDPLVDIDDRNYLVTAINSNFF